MSGWLYLIRNGDLYKIGITKNIENRMRQLKPDSLIAKLYSKNYQQLERELHKRYKNVRIPQSEYFRLDHLQIKEIKLRISEFYFPKRTTLGIFLTLFCLLFSLFSFVLLTLSLTINDMSKVVHLSLLYMERIAFGLSFLSVFIKSGKYLSFLNELKFRFLRSIIFILFAFFFGFTSRFVF